MEQKFLKESAGSKIITNIPIVSPEKTIKEVEELLLHKINDFETIAYIYAVDTAGKLVGAISIKEVFRAPKNEKMSNIMKKDLIKVHSHTHQETLAILAIKHNLKAIPVVDKEDKLLGIVSSDAILNILHKEQVEDFLRSAGIRSSENPIKDILSASAVVQFEKRLPWLIIGLFGGIIAAFVIGFFESILAQTIALVAFIPAIVYIADAAGSQSQTIFIRAIAIDRDIDFKTYFLRETKIGFLIASALGVLMFLTSLLWQPTTVAVILGISFFFAICAAITIAVSLPWIFLKFKIDPAIASGPFATIIRDIISLIIYFAVVILIFQKII